MRGVRRTGAQRGTGRITRRHTGPERDMETSLDFLQARYLANQQAHFVTPDPAGNFGPIRRVLGAGHLQLRLEHSDSPGFPTTFPPQTL
jgi:hypothetical protein